MTLPESDESQSAARRAALWSFAAFFCLMLGYYILRPVREGFGVEDDKSTLKYLYLGTFVGILIAVPLYSYLVSKTSRKTFIPFVFRFFSINLILFSTAISLLDDNRWAGRIFYCWLSVYSVFTVSIVWSYLVDLFTTKQTQALFGPIAVGMSAGAIVGSLITDLGIDQLGLAGLLLIPVAIIELVLFSLRRVELIASSREFDSNSGMNSEADEPIKGSIIEGVKVVANSKYLVHICLLLFCAAGATTIFYFAQNNFVREAFANDMHGKTKFFARMNLATQIVTIALQGLVVGQLVKKVGITTALCVLPFVGLIGLVVLGLHGGLGALIPCYVLLKGTGRGIASPTKQMLFSVVDRQQKYKSKNFIDTVVVRASDVIVVWILTAMQVDLGMEVSTIVITTIPLALVWLFTAFKLGRLHDKRLSTQTTLVD
ncbi:MAG: AAA family ATP:ADP antiporter [Planctomycetota bacterium]